MIDLYDVILFALLIAVLIYWWRISAQKTAALRIASSHCRHRGLQLLDQTLAFKRYRLERDRRGKLYLCREYEFDFSTDGQTRYKGMILLAGFHPLKIIVKADHLEVTLNRDF